MDVGGARRHSGDWWGEVVTSETLKEFGSDRNVGKEFWETNRNYLFRGCQRQQE